MGGSAKTRFFEILFKFDFQNKYIVETFHGGPSAELGRAPPIAAKSWSQLPKLGALARFAGSGVISLRKNQRKEL